MEIIRKANDLRNVLDQEDLLLFENHSLDKKYVIHNYSTHKKVTKLALLINLLHKYPHALLNNIIKEYIQVSNEVNQVDDHGYSVLELCVRLPNTIT